jgi:hypothetical protein
MKQNQMEDNAMELSAEFREYLKLYIEALKVMAWPVFGSIVLLLFKDVISNAVARSKEIIVKVAGNEIKFTALEASDALSSVFNAMDDVLTKHLKPEEKKLFLKVLSLSEPPAVIQLFPEFERDTAEHKMLRALRGVYYIRPRGGGLWEQDSIVEVTNFGKIVAQHKRNALERSSEGT